MTIKLGRVDRIKLKIFGRVYVGMKTRPGWTGYLPFYDFRCPDHGLVESYPMGYDEILVCEECLEK